MQWWSPYQDGTPCEHWNFSSHSTGMCLSLFESIIYFIFDDSYHVVMTGLSAGGGGGPLCLLYICISVPFHAEVSHTHTHTSFYFFTSVSLTFTHVLHLLLCFLFLFKLSVYILMYVYFTVCLKTADDETRCWTSVMSEIWCFRLTRWDWTVLLIKLTSSPVCMSADEWKHSWWIRS